MSYLWQDEALSLRAASRGCRDAVAEHVFHYFDERERYSTDDEEYRDNDEEDASDDPFDSVDAYDADAYDNHDRTC